ncbi:MULTISPECIES: methyltransferase domain-containing protein [Actinoalloteichus]|uniref:Protein-L-isoaspartate O-methyltransferase n=1 Tax=Actinoalloteichus fjordicus TaxID=1612552 RepID=A0AAC9LBZ3_9PSEU|nr:MULTISPECIES: methyltransferase domain-containing protein [Actinoalloteichus]APU13544.1 protein-L-isoaspartate carboxylmethyltransferase [Actinoalloteichus fjordicus]APU19493.1 protein-L-isoaspartate carboxylmethyltransferase [Actinoalloteichus sp. GBA129-24]
MTTAPPADATTLRRQLTAELVSRERLSSPRWVAAFEAVPRHEFVQRFTLPGSATVHYVLDADPEGAALRLAYSDASLLTQHDDGGTPTSSSSVPSLMALMLEALDAHPGHRVLEIGTGTGYNAALLSHALGEDAVTTIDIDPGLIAGARQALDTAGFRPTVLCGDGAAGAPDHAPFDRLITTCGLHRIPPPWLDQVRAGGLILANLGLGLILLRLDEQHTATGRVLDYAAFMHIRPAADHTAPTARDLVASATPDRPGHPGRFTRDLDERPVDLLVSVVLPGVQKVVQHRRDGDRLLLGHTASGSWARVSPSPDRQTADVVEHGPRSLWTEHLDVVDWWNRHGRPEITRLGFTVTPTAHTLWLDDPDGSALLRLSD